MSENLKPCTQQNCGEDCEDCSYQSMCTPETKALLTRSKAVISKVPTEESADNGK